jgi:hypothetical protein
LRHPHQGETRLWVEAPVAGASIGLLGRRKLPAKAVHLRLLVERRGGGRLVDSLRTLAGALRLLQCVLPRAVQLHDLGTMDPADPREGDHVGLFGAPAGQRSGPLAGAAECVHFLTGPDDTAVHQAHDERWQLRRRDGDHDLVQQRQPLLDPSLLQSNATLLVPGAGDQICVSAGFTDLGGARRSRVCSVAGVGVKLLFHDRQQQIAPLGAFECLAFQQALGTGEPPSRASRLSAKEQTHAEPERAANSAHGFAGIQICLMCALERTQVVFVATDQIRRQSQ